jgi:enterochelin esterase-like enzyme
MAGLSMGGGQTQVTVFNYPEYFASAGILSMYKTLRTKTQGSFSPTLKNSMKPSTSSLSVPVNMSTAAALTES